MLVDITITLQNAPWWPRQPVPFRGPLKPFVVDLVRALEGFRPNIFDGLHHRLARMEYSCMLRSSQRSAKHIANSRE